MEAFCRNLNLKSGIPVVNPTVYTNPLASPPISTPSSQVICFRVPNRHDCILIVLQIIVDSIFLQNIIHRIKGEVPKCFCQNDSKKFSNCPQTLHPKLLQKLHQKLLQKLTRKLTQKLTRKLTWILTRKLTQRLTWKLTQK